MNVRQLSRETMVGVAVVILAAVAFVGWLAGSQVRSPAEVAARTAPPSAAPILVPAEIRVLSTDIVTRGTGRFGSPRDLVLAPTELKSLASVLTSQPPVGAELAEGDVGMTVSGRPVFFLEGDQPSFRDLGPGMRGDDVRELESALQRLGLRPGVVDGLFNEATSDAVRRLYEQAGHSPLSATEEQLAEIRSVEATLVPGARAGAGFQVPADEIIFVSRTPVRVSELMLSPGDQIEGAVMTVTDSTVAIDSSLPLEEAGLVTVGLEVLIDEPDLGIETTGVVSRVAEAPGTDGVDGFHVYLQIRADEPLTTLINASVRLTIPIESTEAEVLVVPVTALTLAPDGSSRIQRQHDGVTDFVKVDPGLSADGYVEVTPLSGTLVAGDLVVIGFEQGGETGA